MILEQILFKSVYEKCVIFTGIFQKNTIFGNFQDQISKKKGTIGKYRFFPVDWHMYKRPISSESGPGEGRHLERPIKLDSPL